MRSVAHTVREFGAIGKRSGVPAINVERSGSAAPQRGLRLDSLRLDHLTVLRSRHGRDIRLRDRCGGKAA